MSEAPAAPPQRRPWDVVLTVGLLALGAFNVVASFASIADLGVSIDTTYRSMGIEGRFAEMDLARTVGFAINVVWVASLLWAGAVAAMRLRAGKLAFWVPLLAGVVTALVFTIAMAILVSADPAFLEYLETAAAGGPVPAPTP